jgi:hypothetical protein
LHTNAHRTLANMTVAYKCHPSPSNLAPTSHRHSRSQHHQDHEADMRRTAAYHRRSLSVPEEPPHLSQKTQKEIHHQAEATSTGPWSPMPTTPLILISAFVGTATLLFMLLHFSSAQNASYQTSQLPGQVVTTLWEALKTAHWTFCHPFATMQSFLAYVNSGLYFTIFWLSTVYTPFHYWVMDTLKGKGAESIGKMCGNKFMECRPWDRG